MGSGGASRFWSPLRVCCSVSNSCGHSQELVSIQVQPSVETFGASNIPVIDNVGAQVQLRALGTYIHPPVTKDITSQVTWSSNTPQMFTVSCHWLADGNRRILRRHAGFGHAHHQHQCWRNIFVGGGRDRVHDGEHRLLYRVRAVAAGDPALTVTFCGAGRERSPVLRRA